MLHLAPPSAAESMGRQHMHLLRCNTAPLQETSAAVRTRTACCFMSAAVSCSVAEGASTAVYWTPLLDLECSGLVKGHLPAIQSHGN
jgi:hypothetical protein